MTSTGLRERKKRQTRQLITETAARLFAERGFDGVTVAEIASVANLSEVTVFNYFPTKEDLVFSGMEFFEERLIAAVEGRPPGESPLAAFGRLLLEGVPGLAQRAGPIATAAKLIGGSPALRAREREVAARYTALLARALAAETGAAEDDVEAVAVASALMAVHRALLAHVRTAVLAGRRGPDLAAETAEQARRALVRLESGLAGYAVREQA